MKTIKKVILLFAVIAMPFTMMAQNPGLISNIAQAKSGSSGENANKGFCFRLESTVQVPGIYKNDKIKKEDPTYDKWAFKLSCDNDLIVEIAPNGTETRFTVTELEDGGNSSFTFTTKDSYGNEVLFLIDLGSETMTITKAWTGEKYVEVLICTISDIIEL